MPRRQSRRGVKDEKVSITGTLIIQMIVFLILVGFTMKFVWPPIAAALDERAKKIAEGLAAADKAKSELAAADQRVEAGAGQVAQRDRRRCWPTPSAARQRIVEEAKGRATEEAQQDHRRRPRRSRAADRARPAKPCASRWPRWPSRAPSRSCARKSTPASTPSCSTA